MVGHDPAGLQSHSLPGVENIRRSYRLLISSNAVLIVICVLATVTNAAHGLVFNTKTTDWSCIDEVCFRAPSGVATAWHCGYDHRGKA